MYEYRFVCMGKKPCTSYPQRFSPIKTEQFILSTAHGPASVNVTDCRSRFAFLTHLLTHNQRGGVRVKPVGTLTS